MSNPTPHTIRNMSPIEKWVVFLALGNNPSHSAIIDEIAQQEEGISVAYEALVNISQNADERARYLSRRKLEQDQEHDEAVIRDEMRAEYEPRIELMVAALADKDAVIADKDVALADRDAALANKDAALADKDAVILENAAALADKDAALTDMAKLISELRTRLGEDA